MSWSCHIRHVSSILWQESTNNYLCLVICSKSIIINIVTVEKWAHVRKTLRTIQSEPSNLWWKHHTVPHRMGIIGGRAIKESGTCMIAYGLIWWWVMVGHQHDQACNSPWDSDTGQIAIWTCTRSDVRTRNAASANPPPKYWLLQVSILILSWTTPDTWMWNLL